MESAPAALLEALPDELLLRVARELGALGSLPLLATSRRLRDALRDAPWELLAVDLEFKGAVMAIAAAAGERREAAATWVARVLRPRGVRRLELRGACGALLRSGLLARVEEGSPPLEEATLSTHESCTRGDADRLAAALGRLPALRSLAWLGGPADLAPLARLRRLALGCDLTEEDATGLARALPLLEALEAGLADGGALAGLAGAPHLRELRAYLVEPDGLASGLLALRPARLASLAVDFLDEGVPPDALRAAAALKTLTSLQLRVGPVSSPALAALSALPLLRELTLDVLLGPTDAEARELVEAIARTVAACPALEALELEVDDSTAEGCNGAAWSLALLTATRERVRRFEGHFAGTAELAPLGAALAAGGFPRLRLVVLRQPCQGGPPCQTFRFR